MLTPIKGIYLGAKGAKGVKGAKLVKIAKIKTGLLTHANVDLHTLDLLQGASNHFSLVRSRFDGTVLCNNFTTCNGHLPDYVTAGSQKLRVFSEQISSINIMGYDSPQCLIAPTLRLSDAAVTFKERFVGTFPQRRLVDQDLLEAVLDRLLRLLGDGPLGSRSSDGWVRRQLSERLAGRLLEGHSPEEAVADVLLQLAENNSSALHKLVSGPTDQLAATASEQLSDFLFANYQPLEQFLVNHPEVLDLVVRIPDHV